MHEQAVIRDQASRLREIAFRATANKMSNMPLTYAVASGKGGVGKSTLALNLALALTDCDKKVLLVDSDHNLGNLATLMGITPRNTMADVLRGERDIEDILVSPQPRLKVLPGSSGDFDYPALTPFAIKKFIGNLKALDIPNEYLFLDLSAGMSQDIIAACLEADEAVIVSTCEPTAVMDAYALIKMIAAVQPQHPISIIISGSETPALAQDAIEKLKMAVQHFLHRTIRSRGFIPYDKQVHRSILSQTPLLQYAPSSAAALSIMACARTFLNRNTPLQTGILQ